MNITSEQTLKQDLEQFQTEMDHKISQFQGRLKTLLRRATPPKKVTARFRSKPDSKVSHWLTNMELSIISENNVRESLLKINVCRRTKTWAATEEVVTNTNQKLSTDMVNPALPLLPISTRKTTLPN